MPPREITDREVELQYRVVSEAHERVLRTHGVDLPRLKNGGVFTKDAIVLATLAKYLGKPVSKDDLTKIIRQWFPDTNDVQQARHLGRQKGWYIVSGTRGDREVQGLSGVVCRAGEYSLVTLDEPYPGFTARRSPLVGGLDALRVAHGGRCATCGSREGEPNLLNPSRTTELQEAHMDPTKDLVPGNAIPQCQECNRAYRDWFIFDERGRVRDINIEAPRWRNKYRLSAGGE